MTYIKLNQIFIKSQLIYQNHSFRVLLTIIILIINLSNQNYKKKNKTIFKFFADLDQAIMLHLLNMILQWLMMVKTDTALILSSINMQLNSKFSKIWHRGILKVFLEDKIRQYLLMAQQVLEKPLLCLAIWNKSNIMV